MYELDGWRNSIYSPTKTSPPKSNGEPVGEPLKKLFVVGHVSDDNPRDPRDNPDHFDHIDGTDQGQILGKYMDMDQDE
jgi:hypothetical protein